MNIKAISLVLGLSIAGNLAAAERMCFGQVPVETSTNLVAKITIAENDYFTTRKCKRYFPYYAKHVDFSQAECGENKDQLSLDKGYAPFGVFLRGTDSTGKDNIESYDWEIKNIATNEVLTTYNAFNASYVFDQPGEYNATLTITDKDGSTSRDTKNITVWARDGKDYFVDSAIGDDRYNGLAQSPDNNCDANTAILGSCSGPWKTATRALGELSPYQVTNYPNGEYTADNICSSAEMADIVQYNQGNFKIFRSSTFVESEALKDTDGNFLPVLSTKVCNVRVAKRKSALRPGDQVLFNRGQQFDLETGINTLKKYTATKNGTSYSYERLDTGPITSIDHWSKAIGVHFGAYGSGSAPSIKNTGEQSSVAFHQKGVGMFGFAMSNLAFNLNAGTSGSLGNRATFAQLNGNTTNTVFNNISVKEMNQGILGSLDSNAQGLFIFNSSFYDSKITQIYTNTNTKDVAIVNNNLDYSYNHLIYSSLSHGLVYNNTLSRPSFGRTAYRLLGGDFANTSKYVWISDNKISGWKDPRTAAEFGRALGDGKRYNYRLVQIAPNNIKEKQISYHDIVFTRNTLSDAENLLSLAAGENIKVTHNTFQSASPMAGSYINASQIAYRPFRNVSITNNKFIDTSGTQFRSSFISLSNYSKTKCTDQFNHEKINITNNVFYTPNSLRKILRFSPIDQGKDLSGIDLPKLTLDQAKDFLDRELTMSNNQLISADSGTPTIQIGSYSSAYRLVNEYNSDVDWSQYFQTSDGLYRVYNNLGDFNQKTTNGGILWASTDTISMDSLLATNDISSLIGGPIPEITWDDIIAYAQENNISPADLEVLILNQVLASNPSYSGPGSEYSANMSPLDQVGNWFASIPSQLAGLFESEESKYNDAKNIATTNNVSASKVLHDMKI